MKTATLKRNYKSKVTLGNFTLYDESGNEILSLKTLELPWKENQFQISCIPEGEYDVIPRTSARYGTHYHVLLVPDRSFILFHIGNYLKDTQGCIIPGLSHNDIDSDRVIDVSNSLKAMNKLLKAAPEGFRLKIEST